MDKIIYKKVIFKGKSKILVNPVIKNNWISGIEVDKEGMKKEKYSKTHVQNFMFVIQLGEGVKVIDMKMNLHYGELEEIKNGNI